jgi:hypothetical protein
MKAGCHALRFPRGLIARRYFERLDVVGVIVVPLPGVSPFPA